MSPGRRRLTLTEALSDASAKLLGKIAANQSDVEEAVNKSADTFKWNGRRCSGHELHRAVLANNMDEVQRILQECPEAVSYRFTYETFFKGKKQEGSGTAIHLAASRGHVELMEMLRSWGAQLDSWVTRDQRPHYDVLHAAVFAEGHGGYTEMVQYLLEKRASISKNLDGKNPMHLAFQTGSCNLIPLLQEEMERCGWRWETDVATPLEMGITFGRMSQAQLSVAAPMTPDSLRVFIHHDPDCIPSFLKHVRESRQAGVSCQRLAAHLQEKDLAKLFREAPRSAVALINAVTAKPECESLGWHPLPLRASFAPSRLTGWLRELVNKNDYLFAFYEHDVIWKYNQADFTYPEWHDALDWKGGMPRKDVDIRVCHVPNIINPAFFSSLMHASGVDENLSFYESSVVRGSITYAYWSGTCKVDLLQFFFSIWSLALLVTERLMMVRTDGGYTPAGESLHRLRLPEIPVSRDFIGAKGLLDLVHEIVQVMGLKKIQRLKDYLNLGNLWDLTCCVLFIMLRYANGSRLVQVFVVFSYWVRLLEDITFSEKISGALLPITSLVRGLIPAFIVTLVGFLAFTHGLYVAHDLRQDPREAIYNSFKDLITAGLPTEPPEDILELGLTYISTILFTIFFLNIFIGVIGEQYSLEKQRCKRTFQNRRASACLTFLLRAKVLPCALVQSCVAEAVLVLTVLLSMALQVHGLTSDELWPHCCPAFFGLQVVMFLAAYQNPKAPWAASSSKTPYYLWLATPREREPED